MDVYAGHESLPYSLVTRDAFAEIRALLNADGTVAMNVIGASQGNGCSDVRKRGRTKPRAGLMATVAWLMPRTRSIDPSFLPLFLSPGS